MGAVCTKSLKQIKLENTLVITIRLVFLKALNGNIDFPLKTSFQCFFFYINLLDRSLMNVLWVYLFPLGSQLILRAEQMKTPPCHQARLHLMTAYPQAPGFPRQLQRVLYTSFPNFRLGIGE